MVSVRFMICVVYKLDKVIVDGSREFKNWLYATIVDDSIVFSVDVATKVVYSYTDAVVPSIDDWRRGWKESITVLNCDSCALNCCPNSVEFVESCVAADFENELRDWVIELINIKEDIYKELYDVLINIRLEPPSVENEERALELLRPNELSATPNNEEYVESIELAGVER